MDPDPKFAVCEMTTMPLSFEQDLAAYSAAGAEGIGLLEAKLDGKADQDVRSQVAAAGLLPTTMMPDVVSILPLPGLDGPADPQERIEAICGAVRRAAAIGARGSFCVTGGQAGFAPEEAREILVDGLRRITRVASAEGIEFGIEPLSAKHFSEWTTLSGIAETIALMDEVGDPDLKLMYDVWHLWDEPEVIALTERHCGRFMSVCHIDDWRGETRGWNDRAIPGQGILDLTGLLQALIQGGFDGWYELEIISDDGTFMNDYDDSIWRRDARQVVEESRAGFLAAWRRAISLAV